jgi:gentisate 1,2-dioxygenase
MDSYITAHEYEKNVNPPLKNVPIITKNIIDCDYGINYIDLSDTYNVEYKSTSPNLLASFIKIKGNSDIIVTENENATSHFFFLIQSSCSVFIDDKKFDIGKNDILISPFSESIIIKNNNDEDAILYYINDSPLMNYMGSRPYKKNFQPAIYSNEFILSKLQELANPNNNRKGILLSNKDTEKLGINTITPVLWSLYNELPPFTNQRPHKHNSVALDLCITCKDSENIYTLIGSEIDENGEIVNPIKVNWVENGMFVTPPGLWHSHHNTGNTCAYILPIQDAGLLLYQRILGIVLL